MISGWRQGMRDIVGQAGIKVALKLSGLFGASARFQRGRVIFVSDDGRIRHIKEGGDLLPALQAALQAALHALIRVHPGSQPA